MNIYNYYNKPQELKWHKEAPRLVPMLFWDGHNASYTSEQIKSIAKHPEHAYSYASKVIKDRWPEAEPYILKDPYWAYAYAINVIGDRWPEAEPYIKQDDYYWSDYAYMFNVDE